MKTQKFWIPGPWLGRLAIVSRPRGGDWLEDDARTWRDSGFDIIVSLLTINEISELRLEREEKWLHKHGIDFLSFPISDRGVPHSRTDFAQLVTTLETALNAHRKVGVHCRQGIGRSSLVAASLLVSFGEDTESAWECIRNVRGCPVPDTEEQKNWVNTLISTKAKSGISVGF